MADRISIRDLEVFAYHGATEEERRGGQRFLVDLDIECDLSGAARADDLESTIDYAALSAEVANIMTGERCELIETVAARIADAALAHVGAQRVSVTVKKTEAPMPVAVGWVGVTVTRSKEGR